MNKHILLVMKWLNDPLSVTQAELTENRKAAYDAAYAAAYDAAYAAAYTADAAYAADAAAAKWLAEYFARSGENRQDYVDALATPPDVEPKHGQKFTFRGGEIRFIALSLDGKAWVCQGTNGDIKRYRPSDCTPVQTEEEKLTALLSGLTRHEDIAAAILKAGYHL